MQGRCDASCEPSVCTGRLVIHELLKHWVPTLLWYILQPSEIVSLPHCSIRHLFTNLLNLSSNCLFMVLTSWRLHLISFVVVQSGCLKTQDLSSGRRLSSSSLNTASLQSLLLTSYRLVLSFLLHWWFLVFSYIVTVHDVIKPFAYIFVIFSCCLFFFVLSIFVSRSHLMGLLLLTQWQRLVSSFRRVYRKDAALSLVFVSRLAFSLVVPATGPRTIGPASEGKWRSGVLMMNLATTVVDQWVEQRVNLLSALK